MAEALRACHRVGIDVDAALSRFHAAPAPEPEPEAIARWLQNLRGSLALSELAERSGRSRFAVSRWLKAQAQPRVPDFFRLIDAISGRLPDLVAELVPIEQVPALLPRHRRAVAARRLAFEEPWTEAVLRVLETRMPDPERSSVSRIAARLGIDAAQVRGALSQLEQAEVIQRAGDGYRVAGNLTVDTTTNPAAVREHMAYWARVAFEHFGEPEARNLFAYNLMSVSSDDLSRIRELLRATYREVRAIVAASEPTQTAALLNLQLVEFVDRHGAADGRD
jgi:transcriptional regulator with XRE-family HTH domain